MASLGVSPASPDVLTKPSTRYGRTVRGKPARTSGRHRWIRRFGQDHVPGSGTSGRYGRTYPYRCPLKLLVPEMSFRSFEAEPVRADLPVPLSAKVTVRFDHFREGTLFYGTGRWYGRTPPYRRPLKPLF